MNVKNVRVISIYYRICAWMLVLLDIPNIYQRVGIVKYAILLVNNVLDLLKLNVKLAETDIF